MIKTRFADYCHGCVQIEVTVDVNELYADYKGYMVTQSVYCIHEDRCKAQYEHLKKQLSSKTAQEESDNVDTAAQCDHRMLGRTQDNKAFYCMFCAQSVEELPRGYRHMLLDTYTQEKWLVECPHNSATVIQNPSSLAFHLRCADCGTWLNTDTLKNYERVADNVYRRKKDA